MSLLKCPYLSQFSLQQVRASASHILNAGAESCPIFSHLSRTISTNSKPTENESSSSKIPFEKIRSANDKLSREAAPSTINANKSHKFGQSNEIRRKTENLPMRKIRFHFPAVNRCRNKFLFSFKFSFRLNAKIFRVRFLNQRRSD